MDLLLYLLILLTSMTAVFGAKGKPRPKYKIRMQRNFKYPKVDDFPVYWNVPTMMCHKYNINFYKYTQYWGIVANHDDQFRGDLINILYDPGLFPALLEGPKKRVIERNGGVPQMGNLTLHLDSYKNVVEKLIPKNFAGIGVIDFEAWRPIFRQNWDPLDVYKDLSREVERQKHPFWTEQQIETEAVKNFEGAARVFMETTLKLSKILRPKARWGYYAFPYCFNFKSQNNMAPWCPQQVTVENDKIQWLFNTSTALFPSIYLFKALGTDDNIKFIVGRLNEAWRVASHSNTSDIPRVFPYIWYRYKDTPEFLSKEDIHNSLEVSMKYKMGGAIIWGSSNDVTTEEKCRKLLNYLNGTLGPTLQGIRNKAKSEITNPQQEEIEFFSFGQQKPLDSKEKYQISGTNKKLTLSNRGERSTEPPFVKAPLYFFRLIRSLFMNQFN